MNEVERKALVMRLLYEARGAGTLEEAHAAVDKAIKVMDVGCMFAPDTVTEEAAA